MVEHGLLTEADVRDFTFANPVRLHCQMNQDFFKGTIVEEAAAKEMVSMGSYRSRRRLRRRSLQ